MTFSHIAMAGALILSLTSLSACGRLGDSMGGGANRALERNESAREINDQILAENGEERETIFDLFQNVDDPNVTVEVNRYIWNATLDVLDFLPVEAADPFSGVIDFGYGTPPGGGTAYRATVLINDPALDARSLRVALATRGGPVSRETNQQIEDAILTRARQLRIRDAGL